MLRWVRREDRIDCALCKLTCGCCQVTIAIIVLVLVLIFLLRRFQKADGGSKAAGTPFFKRKWRVWKPRSKYGRMSNDGTDEGSSPLEERTAYDAAGGTQQDVRTPAGVDRNTSVRSVITLPAYAAAPRPTERVIGREGERAGMDVVIEFPETADEEEARREEEMESLYQIRLARRRELDEREERRRIRREARERGDVVALEDLRLQSRLRAESAASARSAAAAGASTTSLGAASLIAEHNARERERRVSSVSYAELGLARHDGTRLRADSTESDHRPLLDSAASVAGSTRGSFFMVANRPRDRSVSSVLSMSTNASYDDDVGHTPYTSTTHGRSASGSDPIPTPSASNSHDTPPALGDADVGEAAMPHPAPPGYDSVGPASGHADAVEDEAPPYESPVGSRAPRLPTLQTLPAIEVTRSTPVSSVAATPVAMTAREDRWTTTDRHSER